MTDRDFLCGEPGHVHSGHCDIYRTPESPSPEPLTLLDRAEIRCRCIWADKRCSHLATQEDGLCDWCGTRRPEQLRGNPNALIEPQTGKFLGLGGANYDHIDSTRRPDACWMDNSGRTYATQSASNPPVASASDASITPHEDG